MGRMELRLCVLLMAVYFCSAGHKPKNIAKYKKFEDGEDQTLEPYATGAETVEATCDKISASCVFEEDKEFSRRHGYTESHDGTDDDTFRPGYYGGIWQVDEEYFDLTQAPESQAHLQPYFNNISAAFGIDWTTVSWENLTIPLYSALGERLYLHYVSQDVDSQIPRDIEEQGDYWVKYYRPLENAQQFVDDANSLAKGCEDGRSDLIFLLDESGSIGAANFELVKQFVIDVINETDVGLEKTRVGVITYSTLVTHEFELNKYDLKQDMMDHVARIIYTGGGTNTALGLDEMRIVGYSEANGARDLSEGYTRVAVVLTDGQSNDPDATIVAADACKNASITMFAIGVGTSVYMPELEAIASNPVCQHLFLLEDGFTELESLVYAIEKGTCDAPVVIVPGENSTTGGSIPPGEDQNCQMTIPPEGATVKITSEGGQSTFYMAYLTYPSESYYDDKVDAYPGIPGVMFIEYPDTPDHMVFCNIKGNNMTTVNITVGLRPGDQDYCANYTSCVNGFCVDLDTEGAACSCEPGYTGTYCEADINECESSPCVNGVCQNEVNSYKCSCNPGWEGTECSTDVNECASNPCKNGGECQNEANSYSCKCTSGWEGSDCSTAANSDINPQPFMVVPLNGTFTASYSLTAECSVSYSKEFREAYEDVVSRATSYLGYNMCTYSVGQRAVAAEVSQVTNANIAQFFFNVYVYPDDDMEHLQYVENCAYEVRDFVKNQGNWRNPIIPAIINCPSNTPTPNYFDHNGALKWDVYK